MLYNGSWKRNSLSGDVWSLPLTFHLSVFWLKNTGIKVVPSSLRNYAVTGIGYSKMVPSMVRGSELKPLFNGFIETYHYLGYC